MPNPSNQMQLGVTKWRITYPKNKRQQEKLKSNYERGKKKEKRKQSIYLIEWTACSISYWPKNVSTSKKGGIFHTLVAIPN